MDWSTFSSPSQAPHGGRSRILQLADEWNTCQWQSLLSAFPDRHHIAIDLKAEQPSSWDATADTTHLAGRCHGAGASDMNQQYYMMGLAQACDTRPDLLSSSKAFDAWSCTLSVHWMMRTCSQVLLCGGHSAYLQQQVSTYHTCHSFSCGTCTLVVAIILQIYHLSLCSFSEGNLLGSSRSLDLGGVVFNFFCFFRTSCALERRASARPNEHISGSFAGQCAIANLMSPMKLVPPPERLLLISEVLQMKKRNSNVNAIRRDNVNVKTLALFLFCITF